MSDSTRGMTWTVDDAGEYVVVRTEGEFNTTDHAAMVQDVIDRPFWRPGRHALFDHRSTSFSRSGYAAMADAVSNHAAHDARIGNGRTAIVMGKTVDFGVGRIFEAVADSRVEARLHIFLDEAVALRWIEDGELPAP